VTSSLFICSLITVDWYTTENMLFWDCNTVLLRSVYWDPARFCNAEMPILRGPNSDIFGLGVVPKGHIKSE